MQRVSVVGNSGSGKSTLGRRISAAIGAPFVELDALNHQPGWQARAETEMHALLDEITKGDRWVIDGNYRRYVVDGLVWQRADTVVWLDLPRSIVIRQIVRRTVKRVFTREELWNGNREPFGNLFRWNPEKSVIRWSWTQHAKYVDRYGAAMQSPDYRHLNFVRLTSHAEAEQWLGRLE